MDYIPAIYEKDILILGCGNILFGDDGFGPEVIKYLSGNYHVPENVYIEDVGTGVREILFDILLSERKPKKIIIIDAVDCGRKPGEIFELSVGDLPKKKTHDFSLHQVPSINLLYELEKYCGIEVIILSCQTEIIPSEINVGLSKKLQSVVSKAAKILAEKYF